MLQDTNTPMTKKTTYQFGVSREIIAENFLRLKGYSILQKRYKTQFGEVDLIAKKSSTLIFVEVKARKKSELIEVILRPKQIERIKNAAQFFVAQNEKYHEFDMRFDFILFLGSLIPEHFEGYF